MSLQTRIAAFITAVGADVKNHSDRITVAEAKLATIAPSTVLIEGASTAGVPNSTVIYFREA